ncbi:MAG: exosortase system-associated protein, TIGR04073 family [Candidatus Omnitrophica bacterium]|nr:exosortase system-associated protein, TIGR04073 family [Candidatus Omnitrophota bacterium]MDD5488579.1 exosortase system-associated protein, TIGR04073 family [Candidatus Omnitrophota bacterium]
MKKTVYTIVIVAVVLMGCPVAHAEDNPVTKLGRGLMNVTTAVFELPKHVVDTSKEDGIATGAAKGTFDGIAALLLRGLVGVYEVATFPVAVPEGYAPVIDSQVFGE